MLAAVVIAAIVLAFLAALIPPRLSFWPQRKIDRTLVAGEQESAKAPGPAGRWLERSLRGVRRTTDASASAGRKSRWRLPF